MSPMYMCQKDWEEGGGGWVGGCRVGGLDFFFPYQSRLSEECL